MLNLLSSIKKINSNQTKHLLDENELKKLQKFDASYFKGKNHFEKDGTQNYLPFQPICKCFKKIGYTENISGWKSKGLSDESIKPPDNSLPAILKYTGKRRYVKFNGSCLKQDKVTFNHGKIVNIYAVYDLKSNLNNFDPTLENCLFGAVKLTKNSDFDKYKYSGYGIGFDTKGTFSFPSGGIGQNIIIFGADTSSSVHANRRTENILIFGENIAQGLDDTTLTAEKMYSINFTASRKKFCLSLHYNEANSYLFVIGTETIKFKVKDSEIVANSLCLAKISEDFFVANMKNTGLYGSAFDFRIDYRCIGVDDVLDIHKYLMGKNNRK